MIFRYNSATALSFRAELNNLNQNHHLLSPLDYIKYLIRSHHLRNATVLLSSDQSLPQQVREYMTGDKATIIWAARTDLARAHKSEALQLRFLLRS
ncbi:hypothetical protein [Pseudomonas sp.]|uniref:hypothetical protein n=1 Tax=Pseudomonas sp. TaxID=306 RepID=UPI00261E159A|nr:hypothetical protein [Pseudomonas sp.]